MKRRLTFVRTMLGIALCAGLLALVAGCTSESAPTSAVGPSAQGVSVAIAPDMVNYSSDQTQALLESGLNARYTVISARNGGKISNGAFTLTIPRGALYQDTQVALAPASAYQMVCQVEPTGLQLRPGYVATLSFDWNGTDAAGVSPLTLNARWFDPSLSTWVPITGVANSSKSRFDAALTHFSYYALAK